MTAPVDPVVADLARLLARGWVRRLAAERAQDGAVSIDQTTQNPVDVVADSCRNCGGHRIQEDACKPA